jgi:hypothetical protein
MPSPFPCKQSSLYSYYNGPTTHPLTMRKRTSTNPTKLFLFFNAVTDRAWQVIKLLTC